MALLQRKPRPLRRDSETLRDDRLFIVACDDEYAPKQYFDFFRIHRVQVHVVPVIDGENAATHVIERLLTYEHEDDDELWLLLDTDHYASGTHLRGFTAVLQQARQQGINVALSRPCFEFWLLLHHADPASLGNLVTASHVEQHLRSVLGQYNKTNLKREHFPLSSVELARERAGRLDQTVSGGEIPQGNTSRIYKLWDSILARGNALSSNEE